MFRTGTIAPRGKLGLRVFSTPPRRDLSVGEILRWGFPHLGCTREVFVWRLKNQRNLWRGLRTVLLAKLHGIPTHYGRLFLRVTRGDGTMVDYGLASLRVVTDTGVAYLVDALQNIVEPENFKYHGYGTGTGVEAAADTALGTELTTQYAVDSTRPTGSQTEGATGNIYRSVGTLAPDSGGTIAITEHGLFSASSAGTLLDRSKFSAVNLVAGTDQLQTTYDLTLTSGS